MQNQPPDSILNLADRQTRRLPSRARSPRRSRPNPCFLQNLRQLGYQRIVGIDEVGRGAIAGPLVVAAVELYTPFTGVDDSKRLISRQRRQLAHQITQAAIQLKIGQVSADEIDELGLSVALGEAYRRCLRDIDSDLVLADNYVIENRRFIRSIQGDSFFYPVAAASIVAKVYRDQLMTIYHQAYPCYNWRQNSGYGTVEHRQALADHGPTRLHRRSFNLRAED